ncbi:hypothetical protein ACROYT_G032334 [Oculina patagonica]
MENSDFDKRESRASTRLNSEDVRRERALSLKRSRSGHLGSLTKAQNEIETLLLDEDSPNVTLVKQKFDNYEILWKNFVLSHNKFMDVAEPEERAENSERFDVLAQQRISLSSSVEKFICDAATKLNEQVMQDLQKMSGSRRHGSLKSRSRRSSRHSSNTYSSKAQARRLEAEKAQLALVFAEQEKQRRVEEETKMLELKRKQRELARMREAEEEELNAIIRLESLKTEADRKLAEARKTAAIMDLEAKLTEEMEEGLSDNESSSVESPPFNRAPPSSGSDINLPLNTVTHSLPPVAPNVLDMPAHLPGASSTAASSLNPPMLSSATSFTLPYQSPPVTPSTFVPTSTKVSITSVNTSKTRVSSTTMASNLSPPVVNNLTPSTLPYWSPHITPSQFAPASTKVSVAPVNTFKTGNSFTTTVSSLRSPVMNNLTPSTLPYWSPPVKSSPFAPASTKVPTTPVITTYTGAWPVTDSGLSPPIMSSLVPWATPRQPLFGTSSVNEMPTPSANGEVLTLVASAMKDISMAQQRLAHNQDLPPIQIAKFVGAPDEFPLFQQRFQHCVMSRKDIDDEKKMTRLLQFLGGEAKEAVCGLETATGGIHQALKILQERYGRPCMIINSVVNNLTKGPPIASGDRAALRKFADQATKALATLKSMNCLSEINQGNIISTQALQIIQ